MAPTLRQLMADYLAEREESVGQETFERIANVCRRLLESLEAQGVTEAAALDVEHVSAFLYSTAAESSDVFSTVKSFVKWLGRRKYAKRLSAEFAECECVLRDALKARASGR
ncbi:MAG: hypothetical protein V1798_04295 [Pseudomonadota bacterium]